MVRFDHLYSGLLLNKQLLSSSWNIRFSKQEKISASLGSYYFIIRNPRAWQSNLRCKLSNGVSWQTI
jgi:hypothetical protein